MRKIQNGGRHLLLIPNNCDIFSVQVNIIISKVNGKKSFDAKIFGIVTT